MDNTTDRRRRPGLLAEIILVVAVKLFLIFCLWYLFSVLNTGLTSRRRRWGMRFLALRRPPRNPANNSQNHIRSLK